MDLDLSDSEWTDLASTHSDSDSSSLSDASDNDLHSDSISLPPSRRSSISIPSDVDGEIEAWEGFADELDGLPVADNGPGAPLGPPEEAVVTAGLEQSLVGTLSASRSSSVGLSTVQNSVRDLRLSFPDPITSSRDELNRSYEAVESPVQEEAPGFMDDVSNSFVTDAGSETQAGPLEDSLFDPLPVPFSDGCHPKGFDVVLYGSNSQCREFAQWLVQTVSLGGETTATPGLQSLEKPSLAIVPLPCPVTLLPHTLYLPVVFDGAVDLETIDLPPMRTLRLINDAKQPVFVDSPEARAGVDPASVYRDLEPFLHPKKVTSPKALLDNLKPVHAVTFVALLSIIMGFAANTVFRPPTIVPTPAHTTYVPADSTPATFWGMFGATPNSSVPPAVSTSALTSNTGVMPSTLKDLALAVFNPATTTQLSSSSAAPSSAAGKAPVNADAKLGRPHRVKANTDMIVRPQSSLSVPVSPKLAPAYTQAVAGKRRKLSPLSAVAVESGPVTSLSLKLGDSLSEIAQATMKALETVLPWDLRELMFACDDLLRAIGRQTSLIIEDTKSQAWALRERLIQRNDRALRRAKDLRAAGQRLASVASDRVWKRTDRARKQAHKLTEKLVSTSVEVWRAYAQAHDEWSEKLENPKREKRAVHRGGLFAKLKQTREHRKARSAT